MMLGENWADTAEEASDAPALTAEEEEAIRTAVYDKFETALWVLTSEDEARTFTGADSRKNGMVGNYPALLRHNCGLLRRDQKAAGC